jgi:hypothetical protein
MNGGSKAKKKRRLNLERWMQARRYRGPSILKPLFDAWEAIKHLCREAAQGFAALGKTLAPLVQAFNELAKHAKPVEPLTLEELRLVAGDDGACLPVRFTAEGGFSEN